MKKFLFPAVLTTALFGVFACNNDEVIENIVPEDQKGLISFSASAVTGSASASQPQTRAGFTGQTQIIARISSTDGTNTRHTRTVLEAAVDGNANNGANWNTYSTVSYATSNNRYWDDAFGRSANLSVYAVAVPEKTDVTNNGKKLYNLVYPRTDTDNPVWNTTDDTSLNTIDWQVSTTQSNDNIANEDLCYSHNIQADKDADGDLKYGKGKNGVRRWNGTGYNEYSYTESPGDGDHYPTLADGCMKFTLDEGQPADGTGHFDKGHMIFHHALTRMTVKLEKGSGFGSDFTPNGITLLKMPYKGTLDFKNGKWSDSEKNDIAMTLQSEANSYMAQFVPGYVLDKTSKKNVMQFGISGNIYYITQDMLYKALTDGSNTTEKDHNGNLLVNNTGNKIELEQGKNYVFTVTVNKQQIESITASLVPWIDVTASTAVKNDYVKINIEDANGKDACTYFDLYRLRDNLTDLENPYAPETGPGTGENWTPKYNWKGDYTEQATKSWDDANNVWKTQWFWESNKAFYHFRTVNQGIGLKETNTADDDYFNIFGGPIQDYAADSRTVIQAKAYSELTETEKNKNYNDYHWGAPFKKPTGGKKIVYDKDYGWSAAQDADKQIYPAIGSTSDQINIIEHHMMSNVRFILKTTRDEDEPGKLGAGAVNLKDAEVTITRIYNKGKVYMGTGKVETVTEGGTESIKTIEPEPMFPNAEDKTETGKYTYRVVPQTLFRGSNKNTDDLDYFVGLTIKTKDDNQYYVIKKLTEVTASTVQQNTSDYAGGEQKKDQPIEFWYPGHDYTYTITISKKGIEAITCSIVPWIMVTGGNINIDLEQ